VKHQPYPQALDLAVKIFQGQTFLLITKFVKEEEKMLKRLVIQK
jgi:hypothetical protein